MDSKLSPVYLDNAPVTLLGDETRPSLSRVVQAGGKSPDLVDVQLLKTSSDPEGQVLGQEETIDRTAAPTTPIYLRSMTKRGMADAAVMLNAGRTTAQLNQEAPAVVPVYIRPVRSLDVERREAQALAESEAEQRQEEQREGQDIMQDEQEEMEDAYEFDGDTE